MKKFIKILLHLTGVIIVVKIYQDFQILLDSTKTEIMSEKAFIALRDPVKKAEIEKAFEEAKLNHRKTGLWENPELDL